MHQRSKQIARLLAPTIVLLQACAPQASKTAALRSVEQFHSRFNDSRFSEIYDESDSDVKTTMSRKEFMDSMAAMREGQGRAIKAEEVATASDSSSDANSIKVLMQVTFEKGKAREEFLYHMADGKAVLAGYHFLGP
jgi:hypothetical protein